MERKRDGLVPIREAFGDVRLKYASTGQSARWDTSCVCVVRTAILMALSV